MSSLTSMEGMEKCKFMALIALKLQPLTQSTHNQLVYWLDYPEFSPKRLTEQITWIVVLHQFL
jgi:hypothetical protein